MQPIKTKEGLKKFLLSTRLLSPSEWGQVEGDAVSGEGVVEILQFLERRQLLTPLQTGRILKGETDGLVLGNYKLLYRNASGSFARVFRAATLDNKQVVALKLLRERWADDPRAVASFQREARICQKFVHPYIVPILDVGSQGRFHFFTMEFVEGGNLRDFLKIRHSVSPLEATRCMHQIFLGLEYALTQGATHRDLKLTNVLMSSSGVAKLVDFGLAGAESPTQVGASDDVQRALEYSSLERGTNAPRNDPRSDIFFAGSIYYELLSGESPWPRTADREERLQLSRYANVRPLNQVCPGLPPVVVNICQRMMELSPSARYQSCTEAAGALKLALAELGDPAEVSAKKKTGAGSAPRTSFQLLVVDPGQHRRKVLMQYFEKRAFRLTFCDDPETALRTLKSRQPPNGILFFGDDGCDPVLDTYPQIQAYARSTKVPCVAVFAAADSVRIKGILSSTKYGTTMFQPTTLRDIRQHFLDTSGIAIADETDNVAHGRPAAAAKKTGVSSDHDLRIRAAGENISDTADSLAVESLNPDAPIDITPRSDANISIPAIAPLALPLNAPQPPALPPRPQPLAVPEKSALPTSTTPAEEVASVTSSTSAKSARVRAAQLRAAKLKAEKDNVEREQAEKQLLEKLAFDRSEAARLEAARLEAARLEAARLEAARLEAERLEAERLEAARLEAARLEAERLEAARLEAARLEAERLEAARFEVERLEAARLEAARLEAARLEAARLEAARLEAARLEAARLEAERLEAARLEAARLEAARLEAARLEAERLEAERLEAERLEAERLEAERLEAERLEAARLEAERLEAERLEAARLEAERLEAARLEAERLEAERLEAERLEAERLEAERLEAERLEAARLEAERLEAARLEAERLEAARLEAERLEAARLEAARLEAARLEAARLEAERLEAARLEAERLEAARLEAERLEAERLEAARLEAARLEAERLEAERLEKIRQERLRLEQVREELARLERERAERQRIEREISERTQAVVARIELERQAREQAEQERAEKERIALLKMEQEHQELERAEADRLAQEEAELRRIERERVELEQAAVERAERERVEQARLEKERVERERLKQERAERERTELLRIEQERAERERIAREIAEREQAELLRIEQERAKLEDAARTRVEQEKAALLRLELERAELERAELERAEFERAELERAEFERAELERAELERAELERAELERAELERAEEEREWAEFERAEKERIAREWAEQEWAELQRIEQQRLEGLRNEVTAEPVQEAVTPEEDAEREWAELQRAQSERLRRARANKKRIDQTAAELSAEERAAEEKASEAFDQFDDHDDVYTLLPAGESVQRDNSDSDAEISEVWDEDDSEQQWAKIQNLPTASDGTGDSANESFRLSGMDDSSDSDINLVDDTETTRAEYTEVEVGGDQAVRPTGSATPKRDSHTGGKNSQASGQKGKDSNGDIPVGRRHGDEFSKSVRHSGGGSRRAKSDPDQDAHSRPSRRIGRRTQKASSLGGGSSPSGKQRLMRRKNSAPEVDEAVLTEIFEDVFGEANEVDRRRKSRLSADDLESDDAALPVRSAGVTFRAPDRLTRGSMEEAATKSRKLAEPLLSVKLGKRTLTLSSASVVGIAVGLIVLSLGLLLLR